jgi:hypothetical protein
LTIAATADSKDGMTISLRFHVVFVAALLVPACGASVPSRPSAVATPTATPTPAPTPTPISGLCARDFTSLVKSPKEGEVLRGTIDLDLHVVEITCFITARTCVTFRCGASDPGSFFCADIGVTRFDTRRLGNGRYTIFAQPACNSTPICQNGHAIEVEIRN